MKRRTILLLLLSILIAMTVACGGDSKPAGQSTPSQKLVDITIQEDKNGQTVDVPKGAQLILRLKSNRTTGFQWVVRQVMPSVLALAGEPVYEGPTPPAGSPPAAGAGGTDVFTFRAVSSGTTPLQLAYVRFFEPNNPPAQTFTVTVNVK
jgi:predicted secreted protein